MSGLADLYNSDLFQTHLLPYLKKKALIPYIQIKEGQTDEEYMFELRNANLKAGAYADLLLYMSDAQKYVESITKELEDIDKKQKLIDGK